MMGLPKMIPWTVKGIRAKQAAIVPIVHLKEIRKDQASLWISRTSRHCSPAAMASFVVSGGVWRAALSYRTL